MLYCISDCSAVGEQGRGLRRRGGNPQTDVPHRRLKALGKGNRKALWYILSRSLSHAIVFHLGEGVYVRENGSSEERDSSDSEESCSDDTADEEMEENRSAGSLNGYAYAFVIAIVIVGICVAIQRIISSGYFHRRPN